MASPTLLQMTQEFCKRVGLTAPSVVATSTDETILQLQGLLNEVVEDVVERGESWPMLQKQATWTSVAADSQGAIDTLFPYGFQYVIWNTAWDHTLHRMLFGPKSAQMWQESIALPFTGPFYAYRIWQGNFYIQPQLAAGHSMYLEYASNYAVLDADGVTYKRTFTKDGDKFLLDEGILYRGLRYLWKKEKGLPWAQDQSTYEGYLAQKIGTAGDKSPLSMEKGDVEALIKPGIFVSSGNWPL